MRPFLLLAVLLAFLSTVLRAQPQELEIANANDYVHAANHPSLMPLGGLTIEAWLHFDPSKPWGFNESSVINKGIGASNSYRLGVLVNQTVRFGLFTGSGYQSAISSVQIPALTWTHVAGTWDGATLRLYVNGILRGTTAQSGQMTQSSGDLYIGRGNVNSNYNWRGRLDEIRVWDHERQQAEILDTMHAQLDNELGLVAAWHFDGGFEDETGGHDLVPVNLTGFAPASSPVEPLQLVAPGTSPIDHPLQFRMRGALPYAPYFLDNTLFGTNIGTPLVAPLSGVFPLDGPLLNLTYGPGAPGTFIDYLGYMDVMGESTATFNVPNFPHLVGLELNSAFLYLTSLQPMVLGDISRVISTVFTPHLPVVMSVSPTSGPVSGGTSLTVTGQYFDSSATVLIGGTPATNVVVQGSTTITCDVPPVNMPIAADVVVSLPSLGSGSLPAGFTYVAVLGATSLMPSHAVPGDIVTIAGLGISPMATITVAGIPATVVTSTPTSIQFTMPAGVACDAAVVITNPEGQTAQLAINESPLILNTMGGTGPSAGGTTFFILGQAFDASVLVSIGGTSATIVNVSPTIIELITPAGAMGLASVIVTNPDGCFATTSFLYN